MPALVILTAGCLTNAPAPTQPPAPASPSAGPAVTAAASPSASVGIAPGRPFVAADVLTAMRESRRPGGVPDRLETEEIAGLVADNLWTFDGSPWEQLVIGGSCGPRVCTLEVAGTPAGAVAEDLYVFGIDPAVPSVGVEETTLRGLSPELATELDELARVGRPDVFEEDELIMTTSRWLPPPEAGLFVLSYRSGGEEEAPAVEIRLDAASGAVEVIGP